MAEDYCVNGMSKIRIERSALDFLSKYKRTALEDNADPLDVENLLETTMFAHSRYALSIVPDNEMPQDIEALTSFSERVIELRASDFNQLSEPCRSRFTACHEVGHAILHTLQLENLRKPSDGIELYRRKEDIPTYQRADWQAETFASAILMPIIPAMHLYKSMIYEGFQTCMIVEAFIKRFMVSSMAAEVRIDMIRDYIDKGEDIGFERYVKNKLSNDNY